LLFKVQGCVTSYAYQMEKLDGDATKL